MPINEFTGVEEEDPTAVALRYDPTSQRMTGWANHGGQYFDVPYISHVVGNLWQGGCANGLILPENIKHVISLYMWEKYTVNHALDSTLTVKMYDDANGGVNGDQVRRLAEWANHCMESGPTLVHCQAGLNRSSLIAATALVLQGYSGQDAIDLLREKRTSVVLCNPAFETWVQEVA